jgi:hypothetical protein
MRVKSLLVEVGCAFAVKVDFLMFSYTGEKALISKSKHGKFLFWDIAVRRVRPKPEIDIN